MLSATNGVESGLLFSDQETHAYMRAIRRITGDIYKHVLSAGCKIQNTAFSCMDVGELSVDHFAYFALLWRRRRRTTKFPNVSPDHREQMYKPSEDTRRCGSVNNSTRYAPI
ncbi:unnamed protein product, partial [Ectocarpus sp. 6 AP-2014]